MYKKISLLLYIIINVIFVINAQTITIIDELTKQPITGVTVFSTNSTDTLKTNKEGHVSLDNFDNSDRIIFSLDYFSTIALKKEEIINDTIILPRGDELSLLTKSSSSALTAKEYSADLPFYVDIINLDDASIINTDNNGSGEQIMFEKNKGVSTVFKGRESDKFLLVLDGVRLNNTLYKNGKISSAINFEQTVIHRVQQLYGASFTMYGADATAGVIHYFTKIPKLTQNKKFDYNVNLTSRYETATHNWLTNTNFTLNTKKIATFTSITYGDYGKIKTGRNKPDYLNSDYGLNTFYVERINNKDSMKRNVDRYLQLNTNYQQLYLIQKFRYKISEKVNILLNFHYNNASEIGIYSGLTEMNGEHLSFAECEFMPHDNFFSSMNFFVDTENIFFNFLSIVIASQYFEEYRYTRKYQNPIGLHQIENLYDYSLNFDFVKLIETNRLTYGLEASYNELKSKAFFENIENNSIFVGLNRYPTNGSFMQKTSAYTNFKWLATPQMIVNAGVRYDFIYAVSNFSTESPQLSLDFNSITYKKGAPAASISIDAYPVFLPGFQLRLLASTTTHIPIMDEYAKVMAKDFIVVIPNNKLKSEISYNFEIGISQTFFEIFRINLSVFNSWVNNAIVLDNAFLNGEDSLYFGTDRYEIATKINIDKAQVYGISGKINFGYFFNSKDNKFIKINSSVNYIKGLDLTNNKTLPNISPLFGQTTINFQYLEFSIFFSHVYNGLKKRENLSIYGEDYIEKAAEIGFASWQTYNIKFAYDLFDYATFYFAINNIFDSFYRTYSSAISAPGRNFIFTLKLFIK